MLISGCNYSCFNVVRMHTSYLKAPFLLDAYGVGAECPKKVVKSCISWFPGMSCTPPWNLKRHETRVELVCIFESKLVFSRNFENAYLLKTKIIQLNWINTFAMKYVRQCGNFVQEKLKQFYKIKVVFLRTPHQRCLLYPEFVGTPLLGGMLTQATNAVNSLSGAPSIRKILPALPSS